MSLTDLKMVENKLVGRREVFAKIVYDKPVKREDVKQLIAAHFKAGTSNVVIRSMRYVTGTRTIDVKAHVYDDSDKLKAYEPLFILVRNKLAERPKK